MGQPGNWLAFSVYMLTIETIIEWEQLTGKRLQDFDTASVDDMAALGYVQHPERRKYTLAEYRDALLCATQVKELETMARQAAQEFKYIAQFRRAHVEAVEQEEEPAEESMTEVAGQLITSGIDGNFLLSRGLEDLNWLCRAAQASQRRQMESARFWAFLQLTPYLDRDKIKNAKDFLPFNWETPPEDATITELEKKMAKALFK